jgi:predicted DsbA family dithiol-disulfide isomerase
MINIDVISDTVCPWCFIGKRRLEKALADRPDYLFQINWRPFQLNPDLPKDGMSRAQYLALKFGSDDRASKIYQTVHMAALEEGLDIKFNGLNNQPNTLSSHRLIRWAGTAGVQNEVVELLFQEYFFNGRDIGDADTLASVAAKAGMDRDLVHELVLSGADEKLVADEEVVARRMGIAGVPCFVIDGKYAVSGAQDSAVLVNIFDLAFQDKRRVENSIHATE